MLWGSIRYIFFFLNWTTNLDSKLERILVDNNCLGSIQNCFVILYLIQWISKILVIIACILDFPGNDIDG